MTKQWASQDLDALQHYNALDSIVTARAFRKIKRDPEWRTHPRIAEIYRVNEALSRIAPKLYARGFYVIESERQRLDKELEDLHLAKKADLLRLVNDPEFKGTPKDMQALLFKRHAEPGRRNFELADPPTGREGANFWSDEEQTKISVDQGTLLHYYVQPFTSEEAQHIIKAYWEAAAPRKARSTYVSGAAVMQSIGPDGRMRATFNEFGTDTGRFSCRQPNLMQIPDGTSDDALGGKIPSCRAMYGAAPGYELTGADWSSQELWVMQAVTGDQTMLESLRTGNIYWAEAQFIFKQLAGQAYNKDDKGHYGARKAAKITRLGRQYGAGVPAIFQQALKQDRSLTYTAMAAFVSKWDKMYQGTVNYWREEFELVRERGYSESRILGKRRYYPAEPENTETNNYPVQATAGDMATLALIKLDDLLVRAGLDAHIVVQLHDAFFLEHLPKDRAAITEMLHEAMCGPFTIEGNRGPVNLDMKIECKSGTGWSGL